MFNNFKRNNGINAFLRLLVTEQYIEQYRARERQRKRESRRQASEAQREKKKNKGDIFLLEEQHANFVAAVTE